MQTRALTMSNAQISFEWLPTPDERLSETRYKLRRSSLRWLNRGAATMCILACLCYVHMSATGPQSDIVSWLGTIQCDDRRSEQSRNDRLEPSGQRLNQSVDPPCFERGDQPVGDIQVIVVIYQHVRKFADCGLQVFQSPRVP